jgi:2TM domain-containing protein
MFNDLAMRLFLIHLAAFVAGTLICAGINFWLTPGTLWFPWVLTGWGAVVATHAFALLLRKTRRRERIFIDKCAQDFAVHLFAYVATVLILLFVNLTVSPKVWWFYWVALGWGAGIAAHGWCAFGKRRRRLGAPQVAPHAPHATKPGPRHAGGEQAQERKGAQRRKSPKRSS